LAAAPPVPDLVFSPSPVDRQPRPGIPELDGNTP
jgi:hypothetical protein